MSGKASLDLSDVGATDLTFLSRYKNVTFERLVLSSNPVGDLAPLRGLSIQQLVMADCPNVEDLRPLSGMPLESLVLDRTGVCDLAPVKGMPLLLLSLRGARQVTNLEPVRQTPRLDYLCIVDTGVTDLSPLAGHPTLRIFLYSPAAVSNSLEELSALPNLQLVGKAGTGSLVPAAVWRDALRAERRRQEGRPGNGR